MLRLLPYNSNGEIDGVLVTLIDISKMKAAEQELTELSEIVQTSDDAIFKIGLDGTIGTWNRGSSKLFSHTEKYIVGKNIELLTAGENSDKVKHAIEQLVEGKKVEHLELRATRRNGEEVDVQMTVSPIYDAEKKVSAASVIMRDFSKQKRAEEAILDAIRRRDQFLAMLSHELRNPIGAIMNALAVLGIESIDAEKDKSARAIIKRQASLLSEMLGDLLDVSRVTHDKITLDLKTVDVLELSEKVIECVESLVELKSQNLSIELPSKPIYIDADATRLVQAQVNLLVNATKYTPDGGSILYSISVIDDWAVIEIKDDGEGMSQELLDKVFDVFVQGDQSLDRSSGGMGLGLPLVKMITTAHGGIITARSDGLGKGSSFKIQLPISHRIPDDSPLGDKAIFDRSLGNYRFMIVEDNDNAREMFVDYLHANDIENVVDAANGLDAIELFNDRKPEICILDIGLPDLNGYEIAGQIRANHSHSPILLIALTGYGQESDREKVLEAGFDLHLVKPLNPEIILQRISFELGLITSTS